MKFRALALLFVMVVTIMLMPVAEAGRGHGGHHKGRDWRDCGRVSSRWDRNNHWNSRRNISWNRNNRWDRGGWSRNHRWNNGPRGNAYGYYANSPHYDRYVSNRFSNWW